MDDLALVIEQARNTESWLSNRRAAAKIRAARGTGLDWDDPFRIAVLGSFTINPLVDFLVVEAAAVGIALEVYVGPYGQFRQDILDKSSGLHAFAPSAAFLILELAAVRRSADSAEQPSPEDIAQEVASLVQSYSGSTNATMSVATFPAVPQWPLHPAPDRSAETVRDINSSLRQAVSRIKQAGILELDSLAAYAGYRTAFSPEWESQARNPFSETFLQLLARAIVSHIRAERGVVRKCLVLDCDNTLWGGVIGEDGMGGIAIGPDAPGREFLKFQKAILELHDQGILLAINSKNNRDDVMQVLTQHPQMLLRDHHFASIQANWDPKPLNMSRIAEELSLGTSSFVFLDDSPVERSLMRQAMPEIHVVELPTNPARYERTLRESSEFARLYYTAEDLGRAKDYAAQRRRKELQGEAPSMDAFLRSLEMQVTIRLADGSDTKRVAQLTQRTNQFNLTTRRYLESEIKAKLEDARWKVWVMSLSDRFGDSGIVGATMVEESEAEMRVDTFLMSCRALGRYAEHALAFWLVQQAGQHGMQKVIAEYRPTKKNAVCASFWKDVGFAVCNEDAESVTFSLAPPIASRTNIQHITFR